MTMKRALGTLSVVSALLLAINMGAIAQDDTGETGFQSELERSATATTQEMLEYAAEASDEVRGIVRDLADMEQQARKSGDDASVNCVVNSLTSARALLQVAEAAEVSLGDAVETGHRARAEHEFRKLAIVLKKSRELQVEGEQCVLGDGAKDGQRRVISVNEPDYADDDLDPMFEDLLGFGWDPPAASPF